MSDIPDSGLPDAPMLPSAEAVYQGADWEWTPENGEILEKTWHGREAEILPLARDTKGEAETSERFSYLHYQCVNGRALFTIRYAQGGGTAGDVPMGEAANTQCVEQLYGVDVIKDMVSHPRWAPLGDDPLADSEIVTVRDYAEQLRAEESSWADAQKTLYRLLIHGHTTYMENGFILRRTIWGARNRLIGLKFADYKANRVISVSTIGLSNRMMKHIRNRTPTSGEWLTRQPTEEYHGKGVWSTSEEYQWAEKWLEVPYGGTLKYGPPDD